MHQKRAQAIVAILAFTFSGLCGASPYVDLGVRQFLAAKDSLPDQTLPVLITYTKSIPMTLLGGHSRHHQTVEQAMIQNTREQEAQVFAVALQGTAQVVQTLWIANGSVAHLTRAQLQTLLAHSEVASLNESRKKIRLITSPMRPINVSTLLADKYTWGLQKIGVPEVRAQFPQLTGAGVRVGILDTGIDPKHPEFKGKILSYRNFSPAKGSEPGDGFGHGTHVAGTIAGGSASGLSIGVAPQAGLIIGRIFDGDGESTREQILAAMQWIADPDGDPKTNDFPQVVNSSWGDDEKYNLREWQDEPFCKIVDNWVRLGIIPVFAAGNSGPNAETIGLPAGCPSALAVGATENYDRLPHFSSAGPAKWKSSSFVKPDVAAPGLAVISSKPQGEYGEMSGTSMATPHVTGALALILQAKPELSVEQATQILIKGTKDLGDAGKDNDFGWGRIDLLKSLTR